VINISTKVITFAKINIFEIVFIKFLNGLFFQNFPDTTQLGT